MQVCKDATGKFPEEIPIVPGQGQENFDNDAEVIPAGQGSGPGVVVRSGSETGNEDPDRIVFG